MNLGLTLTLALLAALALPTAAAAPNIVFAIHLDVDECTGPGDCMPDHTIMCISTDPYQCTGIPCVTAPPWCEDE